MIYKWIKKHLKHIFLLILFLISLSIILGLHRKDEFNSRESNELLSIFSPIFKSLNFMENKINSFVFSFLESKRINNDNESLKKEIAKLRIENSILKESLDTLTSQTQMLHTYNNRSFKFLGAGTVFINSGKYARSIIINKGKSDGVLVNQPAVNAEGLVGIVKSVSNKSSILQLIIDQNSYVGAKIVETNDRCLVCGIGKSSELQLKLEILSPEIKIGNEVVTAGIQNSLYPAGIPIGKIKEFKIDSRGNKFASIKPHVNFQKISNVLLISEFE